MIRKLLLLPAIVAPPPPLIVIGVVITGSPFAPRPGSGVVRRRERVGTTRREVDRAAAARVRGIDRRHKPGRAPACAGAGNVARSRSMRRSPTHVQHSPDPPPGVVGDVERAIRTLRKGHRAMVGVCRKVDGALTDEAVRKDLRLARLTVD